MVAFFDAVEKQMQQDLPFVLYRKANQSQLVGFLQHNAAVHEVVDFSEQGFVFAPFSSGLRLYIPKKISTIITDECNEVSHPIVVSKDEQHNECDKVNFEKLVQKCIDAIAANKFQKVVPSRKERKQIDNVDIITVFKRILQLYPTAFCSLFYHPQIGCWIGATPEQLVKIEDGALFTMALAGTQLNHKQDEVVWGQKEIEEQEFVTQFIHDSLSSLTTNLQLSETYTKRAAKVMHICTDITAKVDDASIQSIVDALHPTPAVCGLPKEASRLFLEAEEGYDRKYYAGYLGELNCNIQQNKEEGVDFYVNLRCMEIEPTAVNIYLGCGVTIDSVPSSEFYETVNKSSTMKAAI